MQISPIYTLFLDFKNNHFWVMHCGQHTKGVIGKYYVWLVWRDKLFLSSFCFPLANIAYPITHFEQLGMINQNTKPIINRKSTWLLPCMRHIIFGALSFTHLMYVVYMISYLWTPSKPLLRIGIFLIIYSKKQNQNINKEDRASC